MGKNLLFAVCLVVLIAIFCSVPVSICAAGVKDTLVIGLNDKSTTLDPAMTTENISIAVGYQLYDSLVRFTEDDFTTPAPALAESWELSEDGKTWIFHLRKDVAFASGNPVNADAVVFSLRRSLKLAGKAIWILAQFGITEDSITKIDEYSVQILLDQQYAPTLFLSCLTNIVARILDPAVVMEHEENGDMGSAWLDTHSAGSGRFVLEERKPGEQIVLKANPNYWGKKPAFERIIMRHIPEPLAQMALLEKGEIDLAWDLQPEQLKRLKDNPEIQIAQGYIFHIRYVTMNLAYEPLSKPEVRDAIRYAIDYDGIIEHVLGGAAIKIQTIIPKGILGYNPAMPYTRDLPKAKQLLADAGYPGGFDVELLCFNVPPWQDVAMKLKGDLAEVGVNVTVTPYPSSKLHEKLFARDFQLLHLQWTLDYVDPNQIVKGLAHCDSLGEDATVKMMAWWANYLNVEISKLIEQADRELDSEKRATLYKQITDIILNDGPYAVMFSMLRQYALRSEVADFVGPPPPYTGFPTIR